MFQAGLINFMLAKFKSVWFLSILYLGLCVGIQVWLMVNLKKMANGKNIKSKNVFIICSTLDGINQQSSFGIKGK